VILAWVIFAFLFEHLASGIFVTILLHLHSGRVFFSSWGSKDIKAQACFFFIYTFVHNVCYFQEKWITGGSLRCANIFAFTTLGDLLFNLDHL